MTKVSSILISLVFVFIESFNYSDAPRIIFLDVGQGDSMLFTYGGFQMIVDGGPGDYLINKLGKYQNLWDREIEVIVLTHPHNDHFFGVIDIFKQYKVDTLVISDNSCIKDKSYDQLISLVGGKTRVVNSLEKKLVGVDIRVENYGTKCTKDMNLNDLSLVTKINIGDYSILSMGDLEEHMEGSVVNVSDVDILKAGHHCSKTSTSQVFLERINPKYIICSVGLDNKFGHPSREKIELFKKNKIKYFVTYEAGDIEFKVTNGRFELRTPGQSVAAAG